MLYVPQIKGEIPVQLVFDQDIISPLKHISDWKFIRQQTKTQTEKLRP